MALATAAPPAKRSSRLDLRNHDDSIISQIINTIAVAVWISVKPLGLESGAGGERLSILRDPGIFFVCPLRRYSWQPICKTSNHALKGFACKFLPFPFEILISLLHAGIGLLVEKHRSSSKVMAWKVGL